MKINAKFLVAERVSYKPNRCILNLARNLPSTFHTLAVSCTYAMGGQSYIQHFHGTEFTVELNELPTVITVCIDGRVEPHLEGRTILKLSAITQLRLLLDLLLAEHPSRLQYKHELI